jgi:acetate kinase
MADAILILNAGSSSLKFSVFLLGSSLEVLYRGQLAELFTEPHFVIRDHAGTVVGEKSWPTGTTLDHEGAIQFLHTWGQEGPLHAHRLVAAGHRVVHGGRSLVAPTLVTPEVLQSLGALVPLAPLHQPHNLAAIRAVAQRLPELPQVACFDTAFHRTQPARAPAAGRTVVAHLGNGASLCALRGGQSVATTMGFTVLDGLPMGTRCGALDPGVLLYLMDHHGMDARGLEELLYHQSGLLGVSGISSDMRTLLASPDPRAAEAIELFVYHVGRALGSLAAALGGLDALVFTGGIGENAAAVRARVCQQAAWLGLEFDEKANRAGGPRISSPASRVTAWVLPTNEEWIIAHHTRRLLAGTRPAHDRDTGTAVGARTEGAQA